MGKGTVMKNQEYKIDIGIGGVSFLTGLIALILAKDMPGRASLFPRFVSVLFMILGVAMILSGSQKIRKAIESKKMPLSIKGFKGPGMVLLMLIAYILIMPLIGFYLTTPFMLVGYMRLLGIKSWKTIVIVAVVVLLFIFCLFTLGLGIPLPEGILG